MKKSPPFLLIRATSPTTADGHTRDSEKIRKTVNTKVSRHGSDSRVSLHDTLSPKSLFRSPTQLDRNFSSTLESTLNTRSKNPRSRPQGKASTNLSKNISVVVNDLKAHETVLRVGILDLGAWLGELPSLIEKLNRAQPLYSFFELLAPIPSGLIKTPKGFTEWAQKQLGNVDLEQFREIGPQMLEEGFFEAAESIRSAVGVDVLVGVTPALIAGQYKEIVFWNHFASAQPKLVLLSTADLRYFAAQAGRPFEAGVGLLLVSALLVSQNSGLGYHADNGCIFDYNGSRVSLIDTLRAMRIDSACLGKMPVEQKAAALAMTSALKRMKARPQIEREE